MSALVPAPEGRHDLELRAERAETHLVRALAELARRRDRALHEVAAVKKGLLLAVAVGALLAGALYLEARARPRHGRGAYRARLFALRRAWDHPDQVARARHGGFADFIVKVIGLAASAFVARLGPRP